MVLDKVLKHLDLILPTFIIFVIRLLFLTNDQYIWEVDFIFKSFFLHQDFSFIDHDHSLVVVMSHVMIGHLSICFSNNCDDKIHKDHEKQIRAHHE